VPKLKMEPGDLDNIDELEEAEYEEGQFDKYDGEVPPTGTMLAMRVTKMWWTYSSNDDPMIKVLAVAEDNPGDLEDYDGLPCWMSMALTVGAKFRWAPFLEHFGLTIRDVKTKTMVESEDDNIGAPITKVKSFVPGSDDALFVGVIEKERYQGKWQGKVIEWLDADTPLDEDAEEEEDEKPARRTSRAAANGTRRATGRGRKPKAEPEDEEGDADEDEAEEAKPARSRRRTTPARSSRSKPTASRGRRAAKPKDDDDEPPF